KKCILVVDDEPGIGKVLRINLNLLGYDVIATTSGAEAIELVRAQEPAVMLLDIGMADVTGFDVLVRVRAFSKVPIIIFTRRPDITEFAKKHGANDSIAKPFDLDQLAGKIRFLLNTNRSA
ncbi:unnamed protein product, partial [marine sediment metagenome]